jgi:hypothetical protein
MKKNSQPAQQHEKEENASPKQDRAKETPNEKKTKNE